jgi:NADPH:quinone reductase-like Zn-dependent oxidoreductase
MSTNMAAYLTAAKAHPLELKSVPVWTPGSNEILIQNRAIAINPIDGSLQRLAWLPLQYPTILGQDVAGEVIAVGSDVTAFKAGHEAPTRRWLPDTYRFGRTHG